MSFELFIEILCGIWVAPLGYCWGLSFMIVYYYYEGHFKSIDYFHELKWEDSSKETDKIIAEYVSIKCPKFSDMQTLATALDHHREFRDKNWKMFTKGRFGN